MPIIFLSIVKINDADYISLTDIAKYKTDDTSAVIGNWMRNKEYNRIFGHLGDIVQSGL